VPGGKGFILEMKTYRYADSMSDPASTAKGGVADARSDPIEAGQAAEKAATPRKLRRSIAR
jgi:hypothetical protein